MRLWLRRAALLLPIGAFASRAAPQDERQRPETPRLPDGKNQQEEILKQEHQQNLKDAGQLIELAEQLKADLEKNDRHVLSMSTLKRTDDIEKLVRKIRARLRRN